MLGVALFQQGKQADRSHLREVQQLAATSLTCGRAAGSGCGHGIVRLHQDLRKKARPGTGCELLREGAKERRSEEAEEEGVGKGRVLCAHGQAGQDCGAKASQKE